jgi:hypothetical protein
MHDEGFGAMSRADAIEAAEIKDAADGLIEAANYLKDRLDAGEGVYESKWLDAVMHAHGLFLSMIDGREPVPVPADLALPPDQSKMKPVASSGAIHPPCPRGYTDCQDDDTCRSCFWVERPKSETVHERLRRLGQAGDYTGALAVLRSPADKPVAMTEDQIKHMVQRFLIWHLPTNFQPDGGVIFKKFGNEGTPQQYENRPVGTNLLDLDQATEMVRHMIGDLPQPLYTSDALATAKAEGVAEAVEWLRKKASSFGGARWVLRLLNNYADAIERGEAS